MWMRLCSEPSWTGISPSVTDMTTTLRFGTRMTSDEGQADQGRRHQDDVGEPRMTFADRSWPERFAKLGDEAEAEFEKWCERNQMGFEHSGRRRPPFSMKYLHSYVRHEPDYLTGTMYFEVKGFGKEQVLKLRTDKLDALHFWNLLHPVYIWVWDSTNKRFCYWHVDKIDVMAREAEIGHFPEGPPYYAIEAGRLFPEEDPPIAQAA